MSSAPPCEDQPFAGDSTTLLQALFDRNRAWAARKTQVDPGFFQRLVSQQLPDYFWIGCSDSRVPATEIVDLDPGEMFVHRNVANLARMTDANYTAALQFAVDVLRVGHIIVVGHYGCGGVGAAMEPGGDTALDRWLDPVRELYRQHEASLASLPPERRQSRLCELNVRLQVQRVAAHPVVLAAWRETRDLVVHGWIYSIETGLITRIARPIGGSDVYPMPAASIEASRCPVGPARIELP
jgi:carbonic anhydrase